MSEIARRSVRQRETAQQSPSQWGERLSPSDISKLSVYDEHRNANMQSSMVEKTIQSFQNWSARADAHLSELSDKVKRYTLVKHEMERLGDIIIRLERRIQFQTQQMEIGQKAYNQNSVLQRKSLMLEDQALLNKTVQQESPETREFRVGQIMSSMQEWSSRASHANMELRGAIAEYVVLKNRRMELEKQILHYESAMKDANSMMSVHRTSLGAEVQNLAKNMMVDEERRYHAANAANAANASESPSNVGDDNDDQVRVRRTAHMLQRPLYTASTVVGAGEEEESDEEEAALRAVVVEDSD
jgi:hypothetical protein